MNTISASEVRSLILTLLQDRLIESGIDPQNAPEDLDLLTEGIIDSMGILEIISAVEGGFGIQLDFADLPPEELTILGPFCRYVAEKRQANASSKPFQKAHKDGA